MSCVLSNLVHIVLKMAQRKTVVFLGYEDEIINEKHKALINFTTNKVGGKPDFPSNTTFENPSCALCQLPQPLVLQIYAPLENDTHHRTLYVFACINPNCWNQNESWTCVRVRSLEAHSDAVAAPRQTLVATDWCLDADSWDDENNANVSEENGNLIGAKTSDEEDESCSFEESVPFGFGNLSIDDRNANTGGLSEAQGGAVGRLHSPAATAEIEGNEGEVISVDTPTLPQNDIVALLQEHAPLPCELRKTAAQFQSYFIGVYEEDKCATGPDHHIRELLQEYQRKNDGDLNFIGEDQPRTNSGEDSATIEKYEEDEPIHGDKMFHYFSSKLQENPGQLLRYSRGSTRPLLLYHLQDVPRKCPHCQGDMVFEFQILPSLIPKLQLTSDAYLITRLEFGNVLIFTCRKSCWNAETSFRYETAIVQREMY